MSSYSVRPAAKADARAIAEIHVTAWQTAYQGLMSDEHLNGLSAEKRLPLWREAIEFAEPQVMVATDAAGIVGFVGFDRSRDPKSKATTGEMMNEDWDQGAGLALWDAAREGLADEGCNEVTLWVLLRNERALRFYELAGFKRELNTARTTTVGGVKLEEIRLRRKLD
jgi:ribosomal protein S18 acetylase RimI-like enzyme